MRRIILWCLMTTSLLIGHAATEPKGPSAERWRGFNLLGMFQNHGKPAHFDEQDFALISELGFNFVRIPMDYRFWIKDQQWAVIDEAKLTPVDQAVAYGNKYNLHVQLCFHRAPGYTVAQPPEAHDLFTDPEALRVCCLHWAFFAKRYRDIPSRELSFNLLNEPKDITEEAYAKVVGALVAAIRAEDPKRFIIADGLRWGGRPAQSLFGLGIGQAMRGYAPMSISHYMASWVGTPSQEPAWPPPQAVSPLYGPVKAPLNIPLVINQVPAGTLVVQPGIVSGKINLRIEADNQILQEYQLEPRQADSNWTQVVYKDQWQIMQGRYLNTLKLPLPHDTQRLVISLTAGDWAQLTSITLTNRDGQHASMLFEQGWGRTNDSFSFTGFGLHQGFHTASGAPDGCAYLKKTVIDPWQPAFDAGIFTMVGEFGAYNRTPHALVLAWMEDNLRLWKAHHLGWALWNFRGSFGILDSQRADVTYESFHGHQLDRKMLDLLLKY